MIFSNSNTIHKCSICTGIDYIYSIRDSLSIYENMTVCLIHKSTTKIITYRNDIVFLKYNIWIWMSPNNKLHDDVKLLQNKITWSFPIKSKQGSEVKLINFPHSEITYSLVSFVKKTYRLIHIYILCLNESSISKTNKSGITHHECSAFREFHSSLIPNSIHVQPVGIKSDENGKVKAKKVLQEVWTLAILFHVQSSCPLSYLRMKFSFLMDYKRQDWKRFNWMM